MSQINNFHRFILRIALLLLLLPLFISIFTSKASLQNANVTVRAVNTNVRTSRSPRPSPRTYTNSAANTYRPSVPEPTPTPANSTVRGRVFYADTGRAVKRASLTLMQEEGGRSGAFPALTDGDGVFQIKNVRAGTYYAIINAPGVVSPLAYADFSKPNDREGLRNAFDTFEKIVVDGVTDVDVQVAARRGGAIGGRVMYDDGDAAIGVKVEILRKVNDFFVSVIPNFSVIASVMSGDNKYLTDDRGVYRFAGLPPGEYIIKVTKSATHGDASLRSYYDPFETTLGNNSFLTVFFPEASQSKEAQIINVQWGQEIAEINLVLPSRNLYKLEGRIVNRRDKSPVKGRVTLKNDDNKAIFTIFSRQQNNSTVTDEKGTWQFKELPQGTYKITVEPFEDESEYRRSLGDYSNANVAVNADRNAPPKPKLAKKTQEVTIENQDLTEMIIEVGYGATISGTARVENSEEMPKNVTIAVFDEKDNADANTSILNYKEPGETSPRAFNRDFQLEGIGAGKKYLSVYVEGSDYYVKSATVGGVDLLGSPFELKEAENLRNVQIVFAKDTGTLKGMVFDDENQPLKRYEFSIVPTDAVKRRGGSFYRHLTTDQNGAFEIKAAPGEYAVIVFNRETAAGQSREEFYKWLDEAIKEAQTVKIEAGKTETVTIKRKSGS